MKNARKVFLICTAMVCLPAWAADVSIGRATLQQLDDSWQVKSLVDKGIPVTGAIIGTQDSETKILMKLSPKNELLGLIVIKGTSSGLDMTNARMIYSPKCDSTETYYARGNTGTNERYFDCLRVYKAAAAESRLKAWSPQAFDIIKAEKITLPASLGIVQTSYANSNRTSLTISALMAPSFTGLAATVEGTLPADVDPHAVLWGHGLQKAAKDSVTSFSGKFTLPPIEFKN